MLISDWSSDVCSSDLPFHARPGFADLFESRAAGVARAEPMTVFREHRLIDRREDHSRRLLNDTIIRRRDAQWAHFTIALGDIDPPHWTRDRKSVGMGKSVSGSVDIGGRRTIKK